MRTERVEVRLDPKTRGILEEMATARDSSVSDLLRHLIERSYEEEQDKARIAAAWRIGQMGVEDVPDVDTLKEQFARAHDTKEYSAGS